MSNWEIQKKKEITLFQPIKLLFENHAIKRMYQIRDIHSGKISGALGINKGRYAQKLASPETFSVSEILRLSFLIDVDPTLIIDVIQSENDVVEKIVKRVEKDMLKNNL
jgi:hypothetical protein